MYNKQSKSSIHSKKKEDKNQHKITLNCLAKCAEWKLNTTIFVNKDSFSLIFQAKSYFFKSLENSILNNCQAVDNVSEILKNTIKSFEEKNEALNSNQNQNIEMSFPIDNTDNNFMILESNLGISDNLRRLVFLEFDLFNSNIAKDHIKYFREVNNNFVEKEIHFVLNGTIHGKQIFKKDLKFSIETRKFIKSIQFRLDNYKNDFIEKQNKILKGNPLIEIKNSKNNFFTKVLSNQNIGIEFKKPNFENVENYPTNFNTIVNSNIVINKIYLELSLPDQVINGNVNNNLTKSTSENLNNSIKINSQHNDVSSNLYLSNISNFSKISPFKADQGNKPYFYVKSPVTVNKRQYHTNSFNFNNEISLYDMINKNEGVNKHKNGINSYNTKNVGDHNYSNKHTKIEKFNFIYNGGDYDQKYQETCYLHNNPCKNSNRPNYLDLFFNLYENLCNLHILLKNMTPYISLEHKNLEHITLYDYLYKGFEKVSTLGNEVSVYHERDLIIVNYSPTLSSLELHITDQIVYDRLRKEISNLKNEQNFKNCENDLNNTDKRIYEYYILESNYKIICFESKFIIEYYDQKPHHFRNIFIDQIEILLKNLEIFNDLKVFKDFEKTSWFAILWSPLKTAKSNLMNTSFLVYYSLNNYESIKSINKFHDFPIIGVLPLRLDEQIWLSKIYKNDDSKDYDEEYKICLDKSIANTHEFIFSNTNQTSMDYDHYFKNSF